MAYYDEGPSSGLIDEYFVYVAVPIIALQIVFGFYSFCKSIR